MTELPENWDMEADVAGGTNGRVSYAARYGWQSIVLEKSKKLGEISSLCQR